MERHDRALAYALDYLKTERCVRAVYLFGSCARGTEKYLSDIDLFVVVEDETTNDMIRHIANNGLPYIHGLPEVDITVYRQGTLDNTESFFLKGVKRDWRLLYEHVL